MTIGCPIIVNSFLGAPFYLLSTSLWEKLSEAVLELFWAPELPETNIPGACRGPPEGVFHIGSSCFGAVLGSKTAGNYDTASI